MSGKQKLRRLFGRKSSWQTGEDPDLIAQVTALDNMQKVVKEIVGWQKRMDNEFKTMQKISEEMKSQCTLLQGIQVNTNLDQLHDAAQQTGRFLGSFGEQLSSTHDKNFTQVLFAAFKSMEAYTNAAVTARDEFIKAKHQLKGAQKKHAKSEKKREAAASVEKKGKAEAKANNALTKRNLAKNRAAEKCKLLVTALEALWNACQGQEIAQKLKTLDVSKAMAIDEARAMARKPSALVVASGPPQPPAAAFA